MFPFWSEALAGSVVEALGLLVIGLTWLTTVALGRVSG